MGFGQVVLLPLSLQTFGYICLKMRTQVEQRIVWSRPTDATHTPAQDKLSANKRAFPTWTSQDGRLHAAAAVWHRPAGRAWVVCQRLPRWPVLGPRTS
ncbi:hypothetical protein EDB80DRAFT_280056 [Ilyonectria destructans]|nr:hypothetical protein EDB80DRAFT_280056 [Ilyonectria destructans]